MWNYRAQSDSFSIEITGGTVRILDKHADSLIREFKGYSYLYTGGIRPDETEFFALENGKHFYIFSLKTFEQVRRITLPRFYQSIDVCGFYSNDGKSLIIPAHRYIYEDIEAGLGYYEHVLFEYETEQYTLISKTRTEHHDSFHWDTLNDLYKALDC